MVWCSSGGYVTMYITHRLVSWCAAWWPNTPHNRLRRFWKTYLISHVILWNRVHGAAYGLTNHQNWRNSTMILPMTYWRVDWSAWWPGDIARGLEVRLQPFVLACCAWNIGAPGKMWGARWQMANFKVCFRWIARWMIAFENHMKYSSWGTTMFLK